MDKGLKDAIYAILILVCIIVVSITITHVVAYTTPDFTNALGDDSSYNQLVEVEKQRNNLMAEQMCSNSQNTIGFWENHDGDFKTCIAQVLNETK